MNSPMNCESARKEEQMSLNHIERAAEFLPKIEASDPSSSHAGTTPGSFARAPKNRCRAAKVR
jgi:DNA-directed RNA polymerase subunit H (RpoH/RPB5)